MFGIWDGLRMRLLALMAMMLTAGTPAATVASITKTPVPKVVSSQSTTTVQTQAPQVVIVPTPAKNAIDDIKAPVISPSTVPISPDTTLPEVPPSCTCGKHPKRNCLQACKKFDQ